MKESIEIKKTIEDLAKNNDWRFGIYDIIRDRDGNICLNGIWSHNNNEIMNEIARKQDGNRKIDGIYKLAWIQSDKEICKQGILIIEEINSMYTFEWKEKIYDEKPNYYGMGIEMNNQLVVFYLEQN
ncbi:MAG: hypothetical protein ABR968_14860 [Bacteroidales bacterium]|jgi:hypothetical protein